MRIALASSLLLMAACSGGNSKSVYELTADDFASVRHELVSAEADACQGSSCVAVTRGDILFVSASGSLSTEFGVVGPNGSEWWGGAPYKHVNRPAFALFGTLGQSELLLGDENVIIAPEDGELAVGLNSCTQGLGFQCSSPTGQFSVAIHSVLKPDTTVATTPTLADNSITSSSTFSLDTSAGWQSSGVSVLKGEKIFIEAGGTFAGQAFGSGPAQFNANGDPDGMLGGTAFLLGNRFTHKLYGRVGTSVIEIGKAASFLAPADGVLEFVVNRQVPSDTSGSLPIEIAKGIRPARGLFPEDVQGYGQHQTINVPATGQWRSTGVSVSAGDPIVFSATGAVTGAPVTGGSVNAFGEGSVGGTQYPLSNRFRFGLYGRVGEQVFLVGTSSTVLAPQDGAVELLVNQIPCTVCDVQGGFDVTVRAP